MVVVVDLNKVVELSRRQLLLTGEEPPVARLFAQPLETGRYKRLVLGSDRTQGHASAIAQGDGPAPRGGRHRVLNDIRTHACRGRSRRRLRSDGRGQRPSTRVKRTARNGIARLAVQHNRAAAKLTPPRPATSFADLSGSAATSSEYRYGVPKSAIERSQPWPKPRSACSSMARPSLRKCGNKAPGQISILLRWGRSESE